MTGVRYVRVAAALGAAGLALAGCARGPKGEAPRPGMIQPIGNEQLYGDVLSQLGSGHEAKARKTLEAMVKRDPSDMRAKAILDTITVDPVAALGAAHFDYKLKAGETLRSVAEKFLGSVDKFYLLARYNQIAVPDGAGPGRVIKVPGEEPRPAPPPEPRPRPAPAKPAPKPTPAPAPKPAPSAPPHNPALAVRLRAAGLAALNGGNVDRAVGLLGQAARLDPDNPAIARDYDRAKRIRQTVKAKH